MKMLISLMLAIASVMIAVPSVGAQNPVLFEMTMGKETFQGYLLGEQGMWRLDYGEKQPFEITDDNGMVRGVILKKIDKIEIAVPGKQGSGPRVTITVGTKTIEGTFNGTGLYIVTDIERIELLKIKKGKVTLIRASN